MVLIREGVRSCRVTVLSLGVTYWRGSLPLLSLLVRRSQGPESLTINSQVKYKMEWVSGLLWTYKTYGYSSILISLPRPSTDFDHTKTLKPSVTHFHPLLISYESHRIVYLVVSLWSLLFSDTRFLSLSLSGYLEKLIHVCTQVSFPNSMKVLENIPTRNFQKGTPSVKYFWSASPT